MGKERRKEEGNSEGEGRKWSKKDKTITENTEESNKRNENFDEGIIWKGNDR